MKNINAIIRQDIMYVIMSDADKVKIFGLELTR